MVQGQTQAKSCGLSLAIQNSIEFSIGIANLEILASILLKLACKRGNIEGIHTHCQPMRKH